MLQLQYRHPISGKCNCRYFKTYEGMFRHIAKYNTFISYCYIDDEEDEPEFHYDMFLPDGFDWMRLVK